MRVAFVTTYDAREVRHYSGTAHFIARALEEQGADVMHIGGMRERFKRPLQAVQVFYRHILRVDHHRDWEPLALQGWATQAAHALSAIEADLIITPSSIPVAYLETSLPIVVWGDATFAALEDFYPEYSGLSQRMRRLGHAAEQRVIDKSRLLVYSSEWAAQSAREAYHAPPERVHVVPYGANLHDAPTDDEVSRAIEARTQTDEVRVLWVGRGWERKGGAVALDAVRLLRERGIPATITLIGSSPPQHTPLGDHVTLIPFLDKEDPHQRTLLRRAFLEARFFLLPTQADCTPIVFSEAAACGLPVLTYDLGGIPSVVAQGISGDLLPRQAAADEFAESMLGLLDHGAYGVLAYGARQRYREVLNWPVAAARVMALLKTHLGL